MQFIFFICSLSFSCRLALCLVLITLIPLPHYTRLNPWVNCIKEDQQYFDIHLIQLELVFTIAAPAFDILYIGCVLNTKIACTTAC